MFPRGQIEIEQISSLKQLLQRLFRAGQMTSAIERKVAEAGKRFARLFFESELCERIHGGSGGIEVVNARGVDAGTWISGGTQQVFGLASGASIVRGAQVVAAGGTAVGTVINSGGTLDGLTANGDIDTPEKARDVLERTGADAVMIGRAAQGRPWIFREIRHYLDCGEKRPAPRVEEIRHVILEHLDDHYGFYGEESGVRVARKHLSWYAAELPGGEEFRHQINRVDSCAAQIASVNHFFDQLAAYDERLADAAACRSFDSRSGASRVEEALAA